MNEEGIRVPAGLYRQSRIFAATSGLWQRLGNLETLVLKDEIAAQAIRQPLYVTSLARAGTTILTEMLERHQDVTSHRYSDFPNIWTPYWRNHLAQSTRRETPRLEERAHKDRIQVNNDSPEAIEEVLWMHFFPDLHEESRAQILRADQRNEAFDTFYRDHIRKLLMVRGADRYLAKGNYNISRLAYIQSLFADARFNIPVRDPTHHIASLAKQHRLFMSADEQDPRVARQLAFSGHFEFGPRRTFINFGDPETCRAISEAWDQGREIEGWARYWSATYRHLADHLENDPKLAEAAFVIPYETLCHESAPSIDALLKHCRLERSSYAELREEYIQRLSPPDYYQPDFSPAEQASIEQYCSPVLHRLQPYLFRTV
jgi:hypothetical protein